MRYFRSDPKQQKKSYSSVFFAFLVTAALLCVFPFFSNFDTKNEKVLRKAEIEDNLIVEKAPILIVKEERKEQDSLPEVISITPDFPHDVVQVSLMPDGLDTSLDMSINNFIESNDFLGNLSFELEDLDQRPRVIKEGLNNHPAELKRKGIEGKVYLHVEINRRGRLRVLEVLKYTDIRFVDAARKRAEATLYSPPMKQGQAVKTEFVVPVIYLLDR